MAQGQILTNYVRTKSSSKRSLHFSLFLSVKVQNLRTTLAQSARNFQDLHTGLRENISIAIWLHLQMNRGLLCFTERSSYETISADL
jgi:uncharacterized protein YhjY with autotransporter beta-barrel domain